jgi:hypothetical protein
VTRRPTSAGDGRLAPDDPLELSLAKEALKPRPEDGDRTPEERENERDRDVCPKRRGIERDDHTTVSITHERRKVTRTSPSNGDLNFVGVASLVRVGIRPFPEGRLVELRRKAARAGRMLTLAPEGPPRSSWSIG